MAGIISLTFAWILAKFVVQCHKQGFFAFTASLVTKPVSMIMKLERSETSRGETIMIKRGVSYLCLCIGLLMLTSCWDRIEIDQRGFVTGIAIDKAEQDEETDSKSSSSKKYVGTYQIITPSGLKGSGGGKEAGGEKGSASEGNAFFNISSTQNSMSSLAAGLAAQTSRAPYFEHLKIIIISAEVAKSENEFADVLDFFLRDNQMRRGIVVLITDGKAKDVLDVKVKNEKYPVAYIESILKNIKYSSFMMPEVRIGDVHEQLLKKDAFAIQKISADKEGISLSLQGSSIFDGTKHKLVGFLSGEETQGLNFMTGQVQGGVVETTINGKFIDLKIDHASRKIKVQNLANDHFKFIIQVNVEGMIGKSISELDLNETETIKKVEEHFQKEIEMESQKTIHTLQKTYKKDAIGLGAFLHQNHYKTWTKVQTDWDQGDQIFSNQVEVEVQAKVKIPEIGIVNENEKTS
jgi:spore germination protein